MLDLQIKYVCAPGVSTPLYLALCVMHARPRSIDLIHWPGQWILLTSSKPQTVLPPHSPPHLDAAYIGLARQYSAKSLFSPSVSRIFHHVYRATRLARPSAWLPLYTNYLYACTYSTFDICASRAQEHAEAPGTLQT